MSRQANKDLKTSSGNYKSQYKQSAKYDSDKVDNIRLRVPKGWRDLMQSYVAANSKYKSVNHMICELIRQEIGID